MKNLLYIVATAAAVFSAASCSNEANWNIDGTVEGADPDDQIILEASNPGGYWYALDTAELSDNGQFTLSQPASQYPDIYRLNYNGNYIYFPIDSTEHLLLKTNAANFADGYELTGSEGAELIAQVEKRINGFLSTHKATDLDTAATLKRELSDMALRNPSSIVSFFIVNKQIGGRRLFRIDNRKELGIIGAVANGYTEKCPTDPHTQYITNLWVDNKRGFSQLGDTLLANQISIIDIEGLDEKGKSRSLSEVASNNKIVILCFTDYSTEFSQPFNIALREVYDAHHSQGLEIFQLGFDRDEFNWRVAAGNQPWVTVYNAGTDKNVKNYNVGTLPALFIINRGELVERVTSIDKLKSSITSRL